MTEYRPERYADAGLWLGLSIGATLLCCTPLGIVGIVYAAMAMDANSRGDTYTAADRAAKARAWTQWSIGLGLLVFGIVICLGLANGGTGSD
jgi:hypothetical protein